jgi:TIR domain
MSNGYLVAAEADLADAHEIGAGFGLEVVDSADFDTAEAVAAALAGAPNVGLILSVAAGQSAGYVGLLQILAQHLPRAQLILVEPGAGAAFAFLPSDWPRMSLADARERARLFAQQAKPAAPPQEPERAHPLPPIEPEPVEAEKKEEDVIEAAPEPVDEPIEPEIETPPAEIDTAAPEETPEADAAAPEETIESEAEGEAAPKEAPEPLDAEPESDGAEPEKTAEPLEADADREAFALEEKPEEIEPEAGEATEHEARDEVAATEEAARQAADDDALLGGEASEPPVADEAPPPSGGSFGGVVGGLLGGADDTGWRGAIPDAPGEQVSPELEPPPPASAEPPPQVAAPAPAARREDITYNETATLSGGARSTASYDAGYAAAGGPRTAPADATAFAPKKLRRGTPELVQVAIHPPSGLKAVIKAARKADPSTDSAPQSMGIGDISLGAHIGVALEARGAVVDGAVQRSVWTGQALFFPFTAEAEDDAKQIVFVARIFINDAQIGMIAFKRGVRGPAKRPSSQGEEARMKRHKRVFLSYSSADRETVAAIATAYESAGVAHFWDRSSLKGGEAWSPRLRREIDKCDLFHLCWSKAAAQSEWVEKEAMHALKRSQTSWSKTPNITVQMLDGPPWAPHPDSLDSINFDDFKRAAIVGYARGEDQ